MPYADKEKQREAQARWYREKYVNDRKFRSKEAKRKAAWLQTEEGKESNAAASARARKKVKTTAPKKRATPKATKATPKAKAKKK
jgi:hypothetical protein